MLNLLSGMPSQPPPLLKPSVSQAQRHPPPLQPQVGVPRNSQGGLQGPPPLIKPMVPPIRPQVSVRAEKFRQIGIYKANIKNNHFISLQDL